MYYIYDNANKHFDFPTVEKNVYNRTVTRRHRRQDDVQISNNRIRIETLKEKEKIHKEKSAPKLGELGLVFFLLCLFHLLYMGITIMIICINQLTIAIFTNYNLPSTTQMLSSQVCGCFLMRVPILITKKCRGQQKLNLLLHALKVVNNKAY